MATGVFILGPAFVERRNAISLALAGDALYAIGGDHNGGLNGHYGASSTVDRLDLSVWPDGVWQRLANELPLAASGNFAERFTAAVAGGKIRSIGGVDQSMMPTAGVYYLDLDLVRLASGQGKKGPPQ